MQLQEILTLLFTGIVAVSTVVYAYLTHSLSQETKKLREVQTEPKLAVFVRILEGAFNIGRLCIKNIGLGPAYNISFELSQEKPSEGGNILINEFSKAKFLSTGVKYLGPGDQKEAGYTNFTKDFALKTKANLIIKTRFQSMTGENYEDIHCIDFSEFEGMTAIGTPPLHSIANSLEKIKDEFQHVIGHRRLKVDTFTSEDRLAERERDEKDLEVLRQKAREIGLSS